MAEARGFEPPVPVSEYNDLANRRLKPLGHASVRESYKQAATRDQAQLGRRPPAATIAPPVTRGTSKIQAILRSKSSFAAGFERGCGRGAERLWSAALTRTRCRKAASGETGTAGHAERFGAAVVGRSQVVRQRILIPPCGGSNPPAPANLRDVLNVLTYQCVIGRPQSDATPVATPAPPQSGLIGPSHACSLYRLVGGALW